MAGILKCCSFSFGESSSFSFVSVLFIHSIRSIVDYNKSDYTNANFQDSSGTATGYSHSLKRRSCLFINPFTLMAS